MAKSSDQNKNSADQQQLPTRSVTFQADLVRHTSSKEPKRARAKGLTLERYIGNALAVQMASDPLPEEQRRIDEFLAEPGRREWLDSWRKKNALKHPPTMADIAAAYKAEAREIRYEALKEKYQL